MQRGFDLFHVPNGAERLRPPPPALSLRLRPEVARGTGCRTANGGNNAVSHISAACVAGLTLGDVAQESLIGLEAHLANNACVWGARGISGRRRQKQNGTLDCSILSARQPFGKRST